MLRSEDFGTVALIAGEAGSLRSSDGRLWVGLRQRAGSAWLRTAFPVLAALADVIVLMCAAILTGHAYHRVALGTEPLLEPLYQMGGLMALLVASAKSTRHEYQIATFLTPKGYAERMFPLWNMIFLAATAFGFLTRMSTDFSRMTIVLYYVVGFASLVGVRAALASSVQSGSKRGTVSVRRTFLVGTAAELKAFGERYQPWNLGIEIVGVATLEPKGVSVDRLGPEIAADLDRAILTARTLEIDDVFILASWSELELINLCVESFLTLPAAIHLGPERIFDRFSDVRISRVGPISSLNLVGRPLSFVDHLQKRALDLSLSAAGLVSLLPLFVALAIAIKLDSQGPVFFRQRRFGFNQRPFNIYKFRSMRTLDDGSVVLQARPNDHRVTRAGSWMRKLSLDELPQLWNVLIGQMSLVGPRPHALAHDREFESKISLYARRHNVKPGITGWAQVNGFRGATTHEKMKLRVEHDLHYIDNWSIWMDLRILALTLLSRKARSNAY